MKYIRLINEFKDIKKIYCDNLNNFDNLNKKYVSETFYKQYCDFEPYSGPSVDYNYINPLWICRNKLNNNCHSGFGCNLCKQTGLKL